MELKPFSENNTPTDVNKSQLGLIDSNIKMKAQASFNMSLQALQNKPLAAGSNTIAPQPSFSDKFNTLKDNRFNFQEFNVRPEEVLKETSSGDMVAKFDNYIPGTNNEERFALEQSTGSKIGNGLLKFGGKTLNAIVGGTVGSVYGVGKWIQEGSFQASYDNDFVNWLDDLNVKMDYKLPNYYTEQEKNNSFGQSLGTTNFWANDVLGGLSFTVGTVISEGIWAWATGGGSLATTGARVGMRAGKWLGEGAALTRSLNKMNVVRPLLNKAFTVEKLATKGGTIGARVGELANTARFTYTSAGFESGVEARHFIRESKENYLSSFEQMNGRLPDSEETADFENNLNKSANALYGFNLGIVGSSNLAIFGKFLNVKSPIKAPKKWANEIFFGMGMKKGAGGELEKIAASKMQKAFAKAYAIGKVPVIEGLWEEGQQSVGNNTASNWLKSGYNPKYMGNTMTIGAATTEGLAETYGSKEGWKEIGIGMIIGLLSGTGMNVARGKGLFAEVNEAEKSLDNEINLRNEYSAEKLLDRIQTANRVQAFTEAEEAAESIGDFTGAELSRKSAIIAHVNNAYNYDYMDEALEEVTTAINIMDNETLMKQYGLKTEAEVADLKANLIQDYSETAESFEKHRDFVENFLDESALGGREQSNRVKEALAYELTLGEHSFNYSRELLGEMQKEIASNYNTNGEALKNALEVQDLLWSSSREIRKDFIEKQKQVKKTRLEREELEKERLGLDKIKSSKEDNSSTLNRLNAITSEIQEKDTELENLNTELEGVLSTAQLQNPYNNESQSFITSRDLENVDKDLQYLDKLVQNLKTVSPQKGYRLEGLIAEYSKSKTAFTRYADLARQLSDPSLGLKGKRKLITELGNEANPKDITLEFLRGMQESGEKTVAERALEAVQNNTEVNSVIERARMVVPNEPLQSKVETISDIINANPYLLEYVGEGQNIQKPTEEQISEYKALVKRIKAARRIPNEQVTRVKPNYYSKKGIKSKLSVADLTRFQELNQLMSDWRLYEGALNDEGISIAQLIEQELSREQEVDYVVVQEDLTLDDYISVVTPTEALPVRNGLEFRDESIIQTYENVKVRVNGNAYEFSHLNLETILNKLETDTVILMQLPTQYDENGYAIEWGKAEEINIDTAIENQKKRGALFTLKTSQGNIPVAVTNQARLQIPMATFSTVKDSLGMDIFKPTATRTTYSDAYIGQDGTWIQMESDFIEEGEYMQTPEEVYNLKVGENTFFKVNINDSYNQGLREDYEEGKITFEELVSQVKVYNVSGNNKITGDLKSNEDISDADSTFLSIRRKAAEILINDQVAQTLVTIPFTAKVKHVILGTPNIIMEKNEDGVTPKAISLTEEALDAIVDFGYTNNGQLILRNGSSEVRLDFVSKLLKKSNVPVIVFKQGASLVAYPVSLVKREGDRASDIAKILANTKLNNTQKATKINDFLAENKINPKEFGLFYISETNQNMFQGLEMSSQLDSAVKTLSLMQDTVDVNQWTESSYSKSDLVNDIEITIDLTQRPLRSPKVIVDFSTSSSTDSLLSWYEEWLNSGTISDEKINEIANKMVNENLNADGRNALTRQEFEVVQSENERINKAIDNIYKLEKDKEKISKDEQNKKCN